MHTGVITEAGHIFLFGAQTIVYNPSAPIYTFLKLLSYSYRLRRWRKVRAGSWTL